MDYVFDICMESSSIVSIKIFPILLQVGNPLDLTFCGWQRIDDRPVSKAISLPPAPEKLLNLVTAIVAVPSCVTIVDNSQYQNKDENGIGSGNKTGD